MRDNPVFRLTDVERVRRLIVEHPWATIVSGTPDGLVASHYPVLLEDDPADPDALVLVTHVGRPDERSHRLGETEVLVIVAGPHGYVSPQWYGPEDVVPTWNHLTAHLWGVPEVMTPEDNFAVLTRIVDHFERELPHPRRLDMAPEHSARLALGTVGIRIRVTRSDVKAKLSQNKPSQVRERIIAELDGDGPYAQPALAALMRQVGSAVDDA